MKILLTGATGFIGKKLASHILTQTNAILHVAVRSQHKADSLDWPYKHRWVVNHVGNISYDTPWQSLLTNTSVIIHAAARVHIMDDDTPHPLASFREVNVEGTLNLARQAIQAGVKRFIYLSSVKVNGEYTRNGALFHPEDVAVPKDPYAISKYEAEQGLLRLTESSEMEIVIIRPPLVYGPGVGGNFLRMMQWLQKGIPLPFGAVKNKRSFVSVNNLVDFILTCVTHPQARNQIFLISDGEDLSTTELLRRINQLLGEPTRLLPVPSWVLKNAATLLGKKPAMMRLLGSLQVDISKSFQLLNWKPVEGVDYGIKQAVEDYTLHYFEGR